MCCRFIAGRKQNNGGKDDAERINATSFVISNYLGVAEQSEIAPKLAAASGGRELLLAGLHRGRAFLICPAFMVFIRLHVDHSLFARFLVKLLLDS